MFGLALASRDVEADIEVRGLSILGGGAPGLCGASQTSRRPTAHHLIRGAVGAHTDEITLIAGKSPKTPLFDNMHITAAFATSEPTSIEKVTRRAGKALEMRESFSDPRSLFGRAHRSTSQSEQQRYILSEEDVRGLDEARAQRSDDQARIAHLKLEIAKLNGSAPDPSGRLGCWTSSSCNWRNWRPRRPKTRSPPRPWRPRPRP
jgi:hypothetical protein